MRMVISSMQKKLDLYVFYDRCDNFQNRQISVGATILFAPTGPKRAGRIVTRTTGRQGTMKSSVTAVVAFAAGSRVTHLQQCSP